MEVGLESEVLQETLSAVKVIVKEAKLEFDENGLSITSVDDANVAMVDLNVPSSVFEFYDVDSAELILNIDRVERIARGTESGLVELGTGDRGVIMKTGSYTFNLSTLDESAVRDSKDVDEFEPPSWVVLSARRFSNAIDLANMFSDEVSIGFNDTEEKFFINAEGETDSMDVNIKADDLTDYEATTAFSLFNLEYLNSMTRPIPKNEDVSIKIGENTPIKIEFNIVDGEGEVTYVLAPRTTSNN